MSSIWTQTFPSIWMAVRNIVEALRADQRPPEELQIIDRF
jgi:hypothetical protein